MDMLAPEVRELLGKLAAVSALHDSVGGLSARLDTAPTAQEISGAVSASLKAEYRRVGSLMGAMIDKESRRRDSDMGQMRLVFSAGLGDLDGRVRRLERPPLWRRISSKVRRLVRPRPPTANGEALARV